MRVLPTRWRQKSTNIVVEQNYVTFILCIIWNYLCLLLCFCYSTESRSNPDETRLLRHLFDPVDQTDDLTTTPVINSSQIIYVNVSMFFMKIITVVKKQENKPFFWFYRATFTSALYVVVVCLSVRQSQAGIALKRLDESSWFLAWRLPSTSPTLRCN